VSRKTHGAAGSYDMNLPLTGEPGVECRSGPSHTLVFTFNNSVTAGTASVTTGTGSVSGNPTFSGNAMTVSLTSVTDAQKITVTLHNVSDASSHVLPDTNISMNVLLGDVTGNKTVNASDVAQLKTQSGLPVSATNFRSDVIANGAINSSDVSMVKTRSGTNLP
jgi:hypothetical protein